MLAGAYGCSPEAAQNPIMAPALGQVVLCIEQSVTLSGCLNAALSSPLQIPIVFFLATQRPPGRFTE